MYIIKTEDFSIIFKTESDSKNVLLFRFVWSRAHRCVEGDPRATERAWRREHQGDLRRGQVPRHPAAPLRQAHHHRLQ
jgi:hypothetical protein